MEKNTRIKDNRNNSLKCSNSWQRQFSSCKQNNKKLNDRLTSYVNTINISQDLYIYTKRSKHDLIYNNNYLEQIKPKIA